jgi:hypothetical protein
MMRLPLPAHRQPPHVLNQGRERDGVRGSQGRRTLVERTGVSGSPHQRWSELLPHTLALSPQAGRGDPGGACGGNMP